MSCNASAFRIPPRGQNSRFRPCLRVRRCNNRPPNASRAAEQSHLRRSANGGGAGRISGCSSVFPSARSVTAVPDRYIGLRRGNKAWSSPASYDARNEPSKPSGPAARRCLFAVVVYGIVGIVTAFSLVNESTSQVETWLRERFPASRSDAFKGMNSLVNPWVVSLWIFWSALAPSCWILRRYVSVGVLIAAPLMPSVALLLDFDFADPNWVVLFGVLTIGVLVGVISGAVLSVLPPPWHVPKMR